MRYHNITTDDMLNGDGLRVVLWVSGCLHRCEGCHNPVTWNPQEGLLFDSLAKQELLAELNKDYISGLTLSGGDPLYPDNIPEIERLVVDIKSQFPLKTIWLYTGNMWETMADEKDYQTILSQIDVLVDGPFVLKKADEKLCWKGSSNQRVIDVQKSRKEKCLLLHCSDYYDASVSLEHINQRSKDVCGTDC